MSEIEKVKAGLMAIENDSDNLVINCVVYCFPDKLKPAGNAKYYYKTDNEFGWNGWQRTHLPTIKASELWDIIQNQKLDNED